MQQSVKECDKTQSRDMGHRHFSGLLSLNGLRWFGVVCLMIVFSRRLNV